jgi:hypothetical protein
VHRVFATVGKIALSCLVLAAFAALAIAAVHFGLRLSASSLRSPVPAAEALLPPTATATPAEIIAARFPSMDEDPQPVTFSAARVIPGEPDEPFDLNAVSGMATADPSWPATDDTTPATGTQEGPEPQVAAAPAERRSSARSRNVLNDAQIASIKQRLKLTAEQERLWPAVEAALRKIVYTKTAMNPGRSGGSSAYIDPASPEVHELKSAALPLLMRLNDEQKREVKMLAYVMGLEAVASQF